MKTLKYSAKGAAQLCCYTIALIATALFTSTAQAQVQSARSLSACFKALDVIKRTAEVRDIGVPPEDALQVSLSSGVNPETAAKIVMLVYSIHPDKSPKDIQQTFYEGTCTK